MNNRRKTAISRSVDVCNGDADGLCSLLQWRLHEPRISTLVAGLRRDVGLLARVHARSGDEVLVCDLPMDCNRSALRRLLDCGATVQYFDHHVADEVTRHPRLRATVDFSRGVCTSLLVDRVLGGRYRGWAVVGAYGKNLTTVANGLALGMGLGAQARVRLRQLGELISYNACGVDEADATIAPAHLYEVLSRYSDPLDCLEAETVVQDLDVARQEDLSHAFALAPYWQDAHASVYMLPDTAWSRRVAGCVDKQFSVAEPQRASAVLRSKGDGRFHASVRAPLGAPENVGESLAGGRSAHWVVDDLPAGEVDHFIRSFSASRWGGLRTPVFRAWR